MGGMEENKKSASPKKNCGYGSLDCIVCIKGGSVPTCGRALCVGMFLNERAVCEALFFLGGKFGGIGELL